MTDKLRVKLEKMTGTSDLLDAVKTLSIKDFCKLPINERMEIRQIINANQLRTVMDKREPPAEPWWKYI